MDKHEKLLYQPNGVSYALAMMCLLCNTYQTIVTLNAVDVTAEGIVVAGIILLNILLSFLVFLFAFEMKRYSLRWSYAALVTGALECLRVLMISKTVLPGPRLRITLALLAGGAFLIAAALLSIDRCKKRPAGTSAVTGGTPAVTKEVS